MARLARVVVPGVPHHVTQNFREGWRGYLWQGRFASFAMDERYLLRAIRHVELNPVRAKLCRAPWRWRWSSAAAHVAGRDDDLVRVSPLLHAIRDSHLLLTWLVRDQALF
jgi:putative transposase